MINEFDKFYKRIKKECEERKKIFNWIKQSFDIWLWLIETRTDKNVLCTTAFNSYITPIIKEQYPSLDSKLIKQMLRRLWRCKVEEGSIKQNEKRKSSFIIVRKEPKLTDEELLKMLEDL